MSDRWRELAAPVVEVEPPLDLWARVLQREAQLEPARPPGRLLRRGLAIALAAVVGIAVIVLLALAAHSRSSAPAPAEPDIPKSIQVELAEKNGSGQSGTATLKPDGDGRLIVMIRLSGNQDVSHPADLGEGSCGHGGKNISLLNYVVGGVSTTKIVFSLEDVASANSPGYVIEVRHSERDGSLLACGEITDVSQP